jgi:hypothetical protein
MSIPLIYRIARTQHAAAIPSVTATAPDAREPVERTPPETFIAPSCVSSSLHGDASDGHRF